MPLARFCFDAGSGTILWRSDAEVGESFVELSDLPVSSQLREELLRLVAEYDTALNWATPSDPGPWTEEQCLRFDAAVRQALHRLRAELPEWQIEDGFAELG